MDIEKQAIFEQVMKDSQSGDVAASKRLYRTAKDLLAAMDALLDISRLPSNIQMRIAEQRAAVMLWEEVHAEAKPKASEKISEPKPKRNRAAVKRGRGTNAFTSAI